jgi:hypothetical protein
MKYKPDFEEAIPRLKAFWKNEFTDRPCMAITAPKQKPRFVKTPDTLKQQWTDHDYLIDKCEAVMESKYYAGEAVPIFRPNLGPDFFSALLGGIINYQETTSWVEPFLDWNNPPDFKINENSFEWKWHLQLYDRIKTRAADSYFVTVPDCHSGGDSLMSMRGGSNLCLDIYDHPEEIKQAMTKLQQALLLFNRAFRKKVEAIGQNGHVTSWLETWSDVYAVPVQLDLLALISPQMFKDFFLDEVKLQCSVAEHTIFHVDGPDAIKHLPIIYDLPVNAIQWVHGAGNGPMTKWIDLLKDIQAHGKALHIGCKKDEIETLITELSSNGLYIHTTAESPQQAQDIIKLSCKLAHQ